MPELPDVEVFRRYLDATALHQPIAAVEIPDRGLLEGLSARSLQKRLRDRRFESTHRHGKYLFAGLDGNGWLVLHFGMSGFLTYFKDPDKRPAHARLVIGFSNGYHLAYDCQRRLGTIEWVREPETFIQEKDLGPDALDPAFDFAQFEDIFAGSRAAIKSALMNQKRMAGVGNVYSDEILFQAGVYPGRETRLLGPKRRETIFGVMREGVLPTAIEAGADPARFPDSYLIPHRHGDGRCPKCQCDLKHVQVSGRRAYFCPACQEDGK